LGASSEEYRDQLRKLARFPEAIHFIDPVAPEEIFSIAAQYDVGLASEIPYCESRNICLTNKLFTYLLSSLCVLASDTAAQSGFVNENENVGLVYGHNSAEDLANKLSMLLSNPEFVKTAKKKAHELAAHELNWELESNKIVKLVNDTIHST